MLRRVVSVACCGLLLGCGAAAEDAAATSNPRPVNAGNSSASVPADAAPPTEGATDKPDSDGCLWELDEVLQEVGTAPATRRDCGFFNGVQQAQIEAAVDCLSDSIDAGEPAQLCVNNCIDCFAKSTYVWQDGEFFHVYREADSYGDGFREIRVERCQQVTQEDTGQLRCEGATELYACRDPFLDRSSGG